jgi:hypothetical protein
VHRCTDAAPACGPTDAACAKVNAVPVTGLSFAETGLPLNVLICRRLVPVNAFGSAAPAVPISGQLLWTLTPGP